MNESLYLSTLNQVIIGAATVIKVDVFLWQLNKAETLKLYPRCLIWWKQSGWRILDKHLVLDGMMEPNTLWTCSLQNQIFFLWTIVFNIFISYCLSSSSRKELCIICMFQNNISSRFPPFSYLRTPKGGGELKFFKSRISFLWSRNTMALTWRGGRVQRTPWQGRAVNSIGECVLVLHRTDPGLTWSSYFMMLRRT